jgi:hypothetical protein
MEEKMTKKTLNVDIDAELENIVTGVVKGDPLVVPFQNCVRQRRPVSKMAAITKI